MSIAANSINASVVGLVNFNGASFDSPTISQYYTVVGDANSNITSIAPGTAGFVLTSNGASSNPSYQAPSASGFTWATQLLAATAANRHGYLMTGAVSLTLPAAPADGTIVAICNASPIGSPLSVVLQADGSDLIQIGTGASSAAGTATSSFSGDALQVVYCAGSSTWLSVVGAQGTWILA